jgi:hypothetical protein
MVQIYGHDKGTRICGLVSYKEWYLHRMGPKILEKYTWVRKKIHVGEEENKRG